MQGFIPGSRATFMVDLVVVAMAAIVPLLLFSVWQARKFRNFSLHKQMQKALAAILLVAVVLFEVEMRLIGWRTQAEASPFYPDVLMPFLASHVTIAIFTVLVWTVTIYSAVRSFATSFLTTPYAYYHRVLGWFALGGMLLTALSGWIFYYMAFIA